jgi:signal transduction histidine kinase
VQPLVNEFNGVLDRNAEVVARARTHAGNLAHALKTPLSVLDQATAQGAPASGTELARLVQEQLGMARRHVDWHLAQARMAAAQRLPGQRTAVIPVVQGLVRVMQRVHAARALEMSLDATGDSLFFAGEEQDLHEILGNLLDNACKWAHSRVGVRVSFGAEGSRGQIAIEIEDDGPGIGAEHLKSVIARGERLDESTPGTGLGLAIVQDLVGLYGGHLQLRPLQAGGLVAALSLPAAH